VVYRFKDNERAKDFQLEEGKYDLFPLFYPREVLLQYVED
jgi:hypothetical protein